jgi:hypothetical protein
MMKRDTTVTKQFDPITSGTSIPNGAGDSDMRWKTVSGGILAGAFLTGTACGQDAIQWQTNAGGNGHWYQLDPTAGINWTDSRSRALARGGDLASIESAEENSILAGPVLGDFQIDGDNQVWLGGRKSDSWEWVDGTEFNFTSWDCPGAGSPCQPDNTGTAMAAVRSFDQVLYWNDIYDTPSYAAGFFIEWSADCNGDGIVDYGQILDGTFTDVNQNGVPDCCDAGQACDIVLHVPGDYATISAAIDAAADGATIRIASGTYTEEIHLPLDRSLEIIGDPNGSGTRLQGGRFQRLLDGKIPVTGDLVVEDIEFISYSNSRDLWLIGTADHPVRFSRCAVRSSAGFQFENAILEDCEFTANNDQNWGPLIAVEIVMRRCRIADSSSYNSGGVHMWEGDNLIEDCVFEYNSASRIGAVSIWGGTGTNIVRRNIFRGNTGNDSDAIGGWYTAVIEVHDNAFVGGSPAIRSTIDGGGGYNIIGGNTVCQGVLTSGPWEDAGGNTTLATCTEEDCDGDGGIDWITTTIGVVADENGDLIPDGCQTPRCIGDLNDDGLVGPPDLGILLAVWGTDGGGISDADIDGNGIVDASDLGPLLGAWGVCP